MSAEQTTTPADSTTTPTPAAVDDAAAAAAAAPPATPLTDAEQKIQKQLQFYFSDANFRRDAFLRGCAESNPEGNVPIATLLTFKRLQSMTTDPVVIARCIADSTTVELSADKLSLHRSIPLPAKDDTKYRTMFAQLIPEDATLDELHGVFAQATECQVQLVRMRRDKSSKQFIGSAFVEYATQSQLRTALEHEFQCKGAKLNTCALEEFLYAAKQRREQEHSSPTRGYGNSDSSSSSSSSVDKRQHEEPAGPVVFTKGLLLKITKTEEAQLDRETIRAQMESHGKVAFIDYHRGDSTGIVRMGEAEAAAKALAANGEAGKEVADDAAPKEGAEATQSARLFTAVLLDGDEEEAYWKQIQSNKRTLYRSRGSDRKKGRHH
jgi:hypothetical protein